MQRNGIMQRWRIIQHELMPELRQEIGPLTPRLEKLIRTLEWVRIEEFVESAWSGKGRPPHDRRAPTRIGQQLKQPLAQMLAELPKGCDRGTKSNAQGYKNSWNGYKLHLDTADCGIPVNALLSSASVHDSQTVVPLALMTLSRVTHCYDLMDAAYCSEEIRCHSRSLGHVPLIDHNPRRGEKIEFAPHEAQRYKRNAARLSGPMRG